VGKFIYGPDGFEIEIEDRMLAHLRIAMLTKLRRNESFSFSWRTDDLDGGGRHSVWIHPQSTIHFHFFDSQPPAMNRAWIKGMIQTANDGDLHLTEESAHRSCADVSVATV
jgi:hypothetical protein